MDQANECHPRFQPATTGFQRTQHWVLKCDAAGWIAGSSSLLAVDEA